MMRTLCVSVLIAIASMPGEASAQGAGFIEGRLSYPADRLPKDLKVCADSLEGGEATCTSKRVGKASYRLAVPAGRYHVWASSNQMAGVKAYFTEHVRCGLKVECKSHRKIDVEVRPGETTRGIDPGDWYDM